MKLIKDINVDLTQTLFDSQKMLQSSMHTRIRCYIVFQKEILLTIKGHCDKVQNSSKLKKKTSLRDVASFNGPNKLYYGLNNSECML